MIFGEVRGLIDTGAFQNVTPVLHSDTSPFSSTHKYALELHSARLHDLVLLCDSRGVQEWDKWNVEYCASENVTPDLGLPPPLPPPPPQPPRTIKISQKAMCAEGGCMDFMFLCPAHPATESATPNTLHRLILTRQIAAPRIPPMSCEMT